MRKAFIIHGTYGHPKENWFPWLKKELEKSSYQVFVPQFPTPKGQNLENWLKVFEKYTTKLDSDTILIGHSCGASFILNLLEKIDVKIKAAYLVAGSISLLNNEYDALSASFKDKEFDWDKIRRNCSQFYVFHSDNDPFVPFEKAEEIAKKLGVKVIVVQRGGHFNADSGYTRFELLRDMIIKGS